jgi:glutamate formiminotransferase
MLIAFNINLQSDDLAAARAIAYRIRSSGDSLPVLKAIGVLVRGRGAFASSVQAQVSMNLMDFETTSLHDAFHLVDREAKASGLQIDYSEIVGLIP